jgi:hypothetical protein
LLPSSKPTSSDKVQRTGDAAHSDLAVKKAKRKEKCQTSKRKV